VQCASVCLQLDSARPYLELGAQYRCLCFWLLPPEVRGLAPVRSEIIRRTAGRGPVLVMDDDAKAWRLSKKNSRGSWAGSRRLTSEEVVARLVAAARLLPEARAVGINHWCHDDCEATSSGAVRSGLQHVSFWPMLLQLPAPVPPQLATHHGCMEDDEFCWLLVGVYGSAALPSEAAIHVRQI